MSSSFINIEKYKNIDKFKKELQKLEEFVTDNEWLTMLKYDIALNPNLSDEISKIIDYINVDTFTAEDYNDLILKYNTLLEMAKYIKINKMVIELREMSNDSILNIDKLSNMPILKISK